jgi:gluconate 2-dehydrogenase gamma chain
MSHKEHAPPARRIFLRRMGGASGAALALPALLGGIASPTPEVHAAETSSKEGAASAAQSHAYLSLGPQEGACVEAIVNAMCPADALTPNGVDCGLHRYIDRQLASGWGRGDQLYRRGPWHPGKPQHGYQSPLSPEQFFKAGLASLRRMTYQRTGKAVEELDAAQLDSLLLDVAAGRMEDPRFSLAAWFNDFLYPLFVQACFADPIYGGNQDKVFWRMVGFPGLPAFYGRDVVQFRGRQHPGTAEPKSIEDFS